MKKRDTLDAIYAQWKFSSTRMSSGVERRRLENRGDFTTWGMDIARMSFSTSVLIGWPVRSARSLGQRDQRRLNYWKEKQTGCICCKKFL